MGKKRTRRRTRPEMMAMLNKWEQSGQSRAAFCRSEGINVYVFQYWQRRCRQPEAPASPSAGFVAVSAPEDDRATGCAVRIKHPGGVEVLFDHPISASFLREVLGW